MPGFPIRTSSDPRSVDSSPRLIAASHVLHRLPVPRHPPCALKHLQHKTKKMSHPHTPNRACMSFNKIAIPDTQPHKGHAPRYSQPLSTNQTPHPTTKMEQQQTPTTPEHKTPGHHRPTPAANATATAGLLSQSPIVCLDDSLTSILGEKPEPASQRKTFVVCTRPASTTENRPSTRTTQPTAPRTMRTAAKSRGAP